VSAVLSESVDVALIGAGIMSATLGTVLKELEPSLDIVLFETLHDCALESSEGWNNAGTGYAANCEAGGYVVRTPPWTHLENWGEEGSAISHYAHPYEPPSSAGGKARSPTSDSTRSNRLPSELIKACAPVSVDCPKV
jgi:hypothetical protein